MGGIYPLSDIRANTISDTSGNGPINLTGQSAAKAYVVVESDATATNSFNMSSTTDGGEVGQIAYVHITPVYNSCRTCSQTKTTSNFFVTTALISSASYSTYSRNLSGREDCPVASLTFGDLA
jgi:hypothetical protein